VKSGQIQLGVVAAILAVFATFSAHTAYTYLAADLQSLKARAAVMRWAPAGKPPTLAAIGAAQAALTAGQAWVPNDPLLIELKAYSYSVRSDMVRRGSTLETMMLEEALAQYRHAVTKRPMAPYAWSNIALTLHRLNREPEAMWQAVDRAIRYGQREAAIQLSLATIMLAHWSEAGEQRQSQFKDVLQNSRGRAALQLKKLVNSAGRTDLIPSN
jgi:hypothetical protein